MRFAPVLALAAVSVCAVPFANNAAASAATDVLHRDDSASVGSTIDALAAREANVDPKAVLATVEVEDSSIVTDILNNQIGTVRKCNGILLPANMNAVVLKFMGAAMAAGVNVQAVLANINIDCSTLLNNLGNGEVIFVRRLPEIVDITALVKAIANALEALDSVSVPEVIADLNIDNSSILNVILNGDT